jgi:hypothetical protein
MLSMFTASVGIAAFTIGAAAFASEVDGRRVGGGGGRGDGGAIHAYASPCAYQYSRWQATRSAYWRDLYYVCTTASDAADESLD